LNQSRRRLAGSISNVSVGFSVHFRCRNVGPDVIWEFDSTGIPHETGEGVVAISDSFFVYENIEDGRALGLNESFEEMVRVNARVLRTARHIVPLYDHRVFERYPGGVIAPVPGEASA
jgi:hypothetical protein